MNLLRLLAAPLGGIAAAALFYLIVTRKEKDK